ncbi:hypothetical protein GPECTOR_69g443 [Gonium pectorale]|uniref:phytol kinase n=1 Tax=Gonium pectorale TaxID=33097 RepID=A0A150G4W8_GONPE|nr:hypothetical protein GPECTOR_69g443 [Gonium pectorale]|eukprot:KXZ44350.1 hypothetical protein GPECTOR_69g443 [Gonium pectorale]
MALAATHHLANCCADQDPISATLLRGVTSDRCVQTAALAVGLAELCAADGGPAYGMPPELLRGLTALFGSGGSGSGGSGADGSGNCEEDAGEPCTVIGGTNMRYIMRLAYDDIRCPPPGRRALVAVALRVMRLAVASVEAEVEVEVAFLEVMFAAGCLLRLPPESGPTAVAEAAELWRLLGLGLRWRWVCSEKEQQQAGQDLSNCMTMLVDDCIVAAQTGPNDLTPEPPPSLAAALAGGVLPLTEMLLRRAVSEHVPAEITRRLLGDSTFAPSAFLAPLLAYGEPRQAAALVATVGKMLALTDPRVVTSSAREIQEDAQQCVVNLACDLLVWDLRWWEETDAADAAAAAGPSAASPLRERLARVLSCAACAWMPALSGLLSSAVQALAPAAKEGSGGSSSPPDRKASAAGAFTLLEAVLPWLPLLVRARELRIAGAGSGAARRRGAGSGDVRLEDVDGRRKGGDGSSSGSGPDGGDDGGWRELIEACAPALRSLGCSLRLAAAAPPGGVPVGALRCLVAACRLVESSPHEPWATGADGAPLQASWPPGALGAVAEQLRATGALDPAATAERLAASLTRRCSGLAAVAAGAPPAVAAYVPAMAGAGRQSGGEARAAHSGEEEEEEEGHWGRRAAQGGPLPVALESLARSLLTPSQSSRAMRSCGYPACTVLIGDSEAERPPLKACAGCGAVGYCCRDCQVAHWRAGHKKACARGAGRTCG